MNPIITLNKNDINHSIYNPNINLTNIQQFQIQAQELQERRQKIFFDSPKAESINLIFTMNQNIVEQQSNCFYQQVNNCNLDELKTMLILQLDQLKLAVSYYTASKYEDNINRLILRIEAINESENNINFLTERFRNIICSLQETLLLLNNFQEIHQQDNKQDQLLFTRISKRAVALRMANCLVDLDKCWDGIYSRFQIENEILNAASQGLAGKIFSIKKDLIHAFISEYMLYNNIAEEIYVGDEIHYYSGLNNLISSNFGINKIIDNYAKQNLPESFKYQFKNTATREVSEAAITRELTNHIHQELVKTFTNINIIKWLTTEFLQNSFTYEIITYLETHYFTPINLLFDATENNQLTIYSLLDINTTNPLNYKCSLNRVKEKLHLWISQCLMPNSERILVSNIFNVNNNNNNNYLSIATIDYMCFWVFNPQDQNTKNKFTFDVDNHISLQLCHIKNIDLCNYLDATQESLFFVDVSIKNEQIAISLLTQAMQQTNDASMLVDFFTCSQIQYIVNDKKYFLHQKIYNLLNEKLTNQSFKEQFIKSCVNYFIGNIINNKLTIDKLSWLLKTTVIEQVLLKLNNNHIDVSLCIKHLDLTTLTSFSITGLKQLLVVNLANKIFLLAVAANNCELMYNLLMAECCNYKIILQKINDIEKQPLIQAAKSGNIKLMQLLMYIIPEVKVNGIGLHYALINNKIEVIKEYIKYINHKIKISSKQNLTDINADIIEILQAKNITGNVGLFNAFKKGSYQAIQEFTKAILACEKITTEQKIKLLQAKNSNNVPGLTVAFENNNAMAVKYFSEIILRCNELTAEQKIQILQAKHVNYLGVSIAFYNGNLQVIISFFEAIFASKELSTKQIFNLCTAIGYNKAPGLSLAFYNKKLEIIKYYFTVMLAYKDFSSEMKFKLLQSKDYEGYSGLYIAFQNNDIQAIKFVTEVILAAKTFSNTQKYQLLLAKGSNGILGLSLAFKKGYLQVITYFASAILNAKEFTNDQKYDLLQAKNNNSFPGLSVAFQSGYYDIINNFSKLILNYQDFTREQKLSLINPQNSNGVSGLSIAFENGYLHIIKNFIEIILTYKEFTDKEKFFILQAKNADGLSGLAIVFKNGYSQTVKLFTKMVLNYREFTNEQKYNLLQAKNTNGSSGLTIALQNNYFYSAKLFIEAILANTSFSNEHSYNLLQAKNNYGFPGLYIAFRSNYSEIVIFFTKAILASQKFTIKEKFQLIQAKVAFNKHEVPGLYIAYKNGYLQLIKNLIEIILLNKDLSDEQKTQLILAKNSNGIMGLSIVPEKFYLEIMSYLKQDIFKEYHFLILEYNQLLYSREESNKQTNTKVN